MGAIKLDQINTIKELSNEQKTQLASAIDLLVATDFDINEGAYYAYSAYAVATIFADGDDGEELEFRLAYHISEDCFLDDDGEPSVDGELNEEQAQAEAFERLCMDILDCNDLILDLYI